MVAFRPHSGEVLWERSLPTRGHAIAASPDRKTLAVFARRPGQSVWIVDRREGRLLRTLTAPPHTQFNGHGLFAPDGRHLWVAATSYTRQGEPRGEILTWDLANAIVAARWSSAGLDPHECALFDGDLVVANGGYAEHYGQASGKQLVAEQPPNLAWLDPQTGVLRRLDRLDDPRLSIRHLSVGPQGVFAGFQHADGPLAQAPLLGRADSRTALTPMHAPEAGWGAWYGYVLSVHLMPEQGLVVATSPRSGRLGVWDAGSGAALRSLSLADVSGVAGSDGQWWVSTGHGLVVNATGARRAMPGWQFDNHMLALG